MKCWVLFFCPGKPQVQATILQGGSGLLPTVKLVAKPEENPKSSLLSRKKGDQSNKHIYSKKTNLGSSRPLQPINYPMYVWGSLGSVEIQEREKHSEQIKARGFEM